MYHSVAPLSQRITFSIFMPLTLSAFETPQIRMYVSFTTPSAFLVSIISVAPAPIEFLIVVELEFDFLVAELTH